MYGDDDVGAVLLMPSRNKRGSKHVPRFLTRSVARSFIFLRAILKPATRLLKYLVERNNGIDVSMEQYLLDRAEDERHVWVDNNGIHLEADRIRFIVSKILSNVFGLRLSFAAYRQVRIL